MTGGGNVVAFDLGDREAAFRFLNALQIVDISNNLGDAKSMATHPCTTTHRSMPEAERLEIGLTEGWVRMSVGLEGAGDLSARRQPRAGRGLSRFAGGGARGMLSAMDAHAATAMLGVAIAAVLAGAGVCARSRRARPAAADPPPPASLEIRDVEAWAAAYLDADMWTLITHDLEGAHFVRAAGRPADGRHWSRRTSAPSSSSRCRWARARRARAWPAGRWTARGTRYAVLSMTIYSHNNLQGELATQAGRRRGLDDAQRVPGRHHQVICKAALHRPAAGRRAGAPAVAVLGAAPLQRLRRHGVGLRAVFAGDVDLAVGLDHVGALGGVEGLQHASRSAPGEQRQKARSGWAPKTPHAVLVEQAEQQVLRRQLRVDQLVLADASRRRPGCASQASVGRAARVVLGDVLDQHAAGPPAARRPSCGLADRQPHPGRRLLGLGEILLGAERQRLALDRR